MLDALAAVAPIVAMDPRALGVLRARLSLVTSLPRALTDLAPRRAVSARASSVDAPPYPVVDRVAHLALSGMMLSPVPWWFVFLDIVATDTAELTTHLARATADPEIQAIVIDTDSPGGSASGVDALARAVRRSAARKPIFAHVHEAACSGALWAISGATEIHASPGAFVGSIGCYTSLDDSTAELERRGVARTLITTGGVKGLGLEGTPVTEPLIEDQTRMVREILDLFTDALARGRELEPAAASKLATGHTWPAVKAQALGLVDRITTPRVTHSAASAAALPALARAHLKRSA